MTPNPFIRLVALILAASLAAQPAFTAVARDESRDMSTIQRHSQVSSLISFPSSLFVEQALALHSVASMHQDRTAADIAESAAQLLRLGPPAVLPEGSSPSVAETLKKLLGTVQAAIHERQLDQAKQRMELAQDLFVRYVQAPGVSRCGGYLIEAYHDLIKALLNQRPPAAENALVLYGKIQESLAYPAVRNLSFVKNARPRLSTLVADILAAQSPPRYAIMEQEPEDSKRKGISRRARARSVKSRTIRKAEQERERAEDRIPPPLPAWSEQSTAVLGLDDIKAMRDAGDLKRTLDFSVSYTYEHPRDDRGFVFLGNLYMSLDHPNAAITAYQRAANLSPYDPYAQARVLTAQGAQALMEERVIDALHLVENAIHSAPGYERAGSLMQKIFHSLIEPAGYDRPTMDVLQVAAAVSHRLRYREINLQLWRRAVALQPLDIDVRSKLILSLAQWKHFPEAWKELRRARRELRDPLELAGVETNLLDLQRAASSAPAPGRTAALAVGRDIIQLSSEIKFLHSPAAWGTSMEAALFEADRKLLDLFLLAGALPRPKEGQAAYLLSGIDSLFFEKIRGVSVDIRAGHIPFNLLDQKLHLLRIPSLDQKAIAQNRRGSVPVDIRQIAFAKSELGRWGAFSHLYTKQASFYFQRALVQDGLPEWDAQMAALKLFCDIARHLLASDARWIMIERKIEDRLLTKVLDDLGLEDVWPSLIPEEAFNNLEDAGALEAGIRINEDWSYALSGKIHAYRWKHLSRSA